MVFNYDEIYPEDPGVGVSRKILAYGGSLMSVEVSFKKGAIGSMHSHPHEQISVVLSGKFEYNEDGKKTVLKKGDSYYVKGGVPHGVLALEEGVLLDIFTPIREDFLKKNNWL